MNAVMISYKDWKKERQKGIGGSDAAAVLGVSRWKSPLRLYLEKLGEIKPEVDNNFMLWGRKLEKLVIEHFMEVTGKTVEKIDKILVHPEYPFMIANLDGYIPEEDAVVEVKTASSYKLDEWSGDNIPVEYVLQGQHYLAVTGCSKVYYPVLIGGNTFFIKEMTRDEELINMIIDAESKFWHENIEKRIPPEMTGAVDAKELLDKLYPTAREGMKVELPHLEDVVNQLAVTQAKIKELEQLADELQAKIKEQMGEAEIAEVGNFVVTWKSVTTERLDTSKLKKELPDVYKQFLTSSTSRRFSLKAKKEG